MEECTCTSSSTQQPWWHLSCAQHKNFGEPAKAAMVTFRLTSAISQRQDPPQQLELSRVQAQLEPSSCNRDSQRCKAVGGSHRGQGHLRRKDPPQQLIGDLQLQQEGAVDIQPSAARAAHGCRHQNHQDVGRDDHAAAGNIGFHLQLTRQQLL